MTKPTIVIHPLTISVPPTGPHRALISPSGSPISPTRARRNRNRALQHRPGERYLRVPTEASTRNIEGVLSASQTAVSEEVSPVSSGDEGDKPPPSPLLAAEDIEEIHEFLERKPWIDDKIRSYETMRDIDVFAGTTELASAVDPGQPVTGLPDREQYQVWLSQQQTIEKEMACFDKGVLMRLKAFAKTTSRQNLSAEDTDLVELTLHTLLGLEKLSALIRRRSDKLEALRLRMLWEDQRMEAWTDRQNILADLEAFVKKSRWCPSSYDVHRNVDPDNEIKLPSMPSTPPKSPPAYERLRTISNTSLSGTVPNTVIIPPALLPTSDTDFSRTHRFNLADSLSREAAGYAKRVMEYKSSRVTVAAHTLEKLIAVSREKVPDEILSEQDRLEVKTSVLDGLGRFAMNIAMQWIKADQSFGDIKRVQALAQHLHQEIIDAKATHPTSRMNEAFQSRAATLKSKVHGLADPATSRSFPRPLHPAYPDQHASNQYVTNVLSLEIQKARNMAAQVNALSEEYRTLYEAVKHMDTLMDDMRTISSRLSTATDRLVKGSSSKNGDGSRIDLSTEACLDPMRHMVYLASLPAVTKELDEADALAERTVTSCTGILSDLKDAGVEVSPTLINGAQEMIQRLQTERLLSEDVLDKVSADSTRLREVRELWTSIQEASHVVHMMRTQLQAASERQRWQPILKDGEEDVVSTQEEEAEDDFTIVNKSTSTSPDVDLSPPEIHRQLDELSSHIASVISTRQSGMLPGLNTRLADYISTGYDSLISDVAVLREAVRMWDEVVGQARIMDEVKHEAGNLQQRVDNLKVKLTSTRRSITDDTVDVDGSSLIAKEIVMARDFAKLQDEIRLFSTNLTSRIPLFNSHANSQAPRLVTSIIKTDPIKQAASRLFSFCLDDLDDDVKDDANYLATSLGDSINGMQVQINQLRITGYVMYAASFLIPKRLWPCIRFKDYALTVSSGILSTDQYYAAALSYVRALKESLFGDGGRGELEEFQHASRLHFAQLTQEVASLRRQYEHEREERLRTQREFKREIDAILEELRNNQTMTPAPVSTARLEGVASALASMATFSLKDGESVGSEDQLSRLMRTLPLNFRTQKNVSFQSQSSK